MNQVLNDRFVTQRAAGQRWQRLERARTVLARRVGATLLVGCVLSCASEPHQGADAGFDSGEDDAPIVPARLEVTALAGGSGVLTLRALTLSRARSGIVLYAALENVGEAPACSAAFSVELFDAQAQSLAAGIGALLTQRFYRVNDGSDAVAACVGPGDVAMVSVSDLPSELALEEVASIVYRCPYFALDVTALEGMSIRELEALPRGAGVAYTGILHNQLALTLRNPSVTLFPINRAARPLGSVVSQGALDVAPGGRWRFESEIVEARGVDVAAYPTAELTAPR